MKAIIDAIETKIGRKIEIVKASDGANLMFSALSEGVKIANIYKSFDSRFNQILITRFII